MPEKIRSITDGEYREEVLMQAWMLLSAQRGQLSTLDLSPKVAEKRLKRLVEKNPWLVEPYGYKPTAGDEQREVTPLSSLEETIGGGYLGKAA